MVRGEGLHNLGHRVRSRQGGRSFEGRRNELRAIYNIDTSRDQRAQFAVEYGCKCKQQRDNREIPRMQVAVRQIDFASARRDQPRCPNGVDKASSRPWLTASIGRTDR